MKKDKNCKQKLTQVVCVILYDHNKKVLLQHRTEDALRLPGYWAFFGGGIEEGETILEAAAREIEEEVNFKSKNLQLIVKQKFKMLGEKRLKNVYIEFCEDKSSLKLNEGQGWGWYNINETNKLKMIFHDRTILRHAEKKLQKTNLTQLNRPNFPLNKQPRNAQR